MTRLPYLALALTCFVVHPAYAACGAAGCAINTNWETQGPHVGPGWRIDLRFEYIKQDTLRKGANKVAHAKPETSVGAHEEEEEHAHAETAAARYRPVRAQHEGDEHAEGTHAEHDERETLNRNARVHIDYSFNERFGVSAEVPVVARKHRHIELAGGATQSWNFTALGDARVLGRYALAGKENMLWGLKFGAKLPTGKFDETNNAGATAERTLQPGTGTTDALLGAFYQRGNVASPWSWFGQVLLQQALNSRDGFKPGRQVSADAGVGYRLHERVTAMLQLNLQHRARDQGENAEPEDSGTEFAYLSPGVQVRLGTSTQAYAFVQLPVYQRVKGIQLSADQALLVGLSHRF